MMTSATAPGKVILLGEHSVVYGRPAIAVPVFERRATACIEAAAPGTGCTIEMPDVGRTLCLAPQKEARGKEDEPLAVAARATLAQLGLPADPDWRIVLSSTLPIAGGLGSGAALLAALVRAIHLHAGQTPDPAEVSRLVYLGEEIFHGTPSGIDNTVVAYGRPVWFVRGQAPVVFHPGASFQLAIADSGAPASTKESVAGVRQRRAADPATYDAWFDAIGKLVSQARRAIEEGQIGEIGALLDANQVYLAKMGVSTHGLEQLIRAARRAGAQGAKLSGGGGGGNVIALVDEHSAQAVQHGLETAGAVRVVITTVGA